MRKFFHHMDSKMADHYIYADCSDSTDGHKYYINELKTFKQFQKDVERMKEEHFVAGQATESTITRWPSGYFCREFADGTIRRSFKKLLRKNTCPELMERKKQNGNICPEENNLCDSRYKNAVALHAMISEVCGDTNKVKLLYIVTDGSLDSESVKNCIELKKDMQYEKVVFHAFNEDLSKIDLSVAVPFLKGRCIVYRNNELIDDIDVSEEFDYNKITIDNFETEIKSLKPYIRLKFIRTSKPDAVALQEVAKLKKLRDRLFKEVSLKLQKSRVNLETKKRNVFLQEFASTNWYAGCKGWDQKTEYNIKKSILNLINYIVSDTKSYSFDTLTLDTEFEIPTEEEPDVDDDFPMEQRIIYPDIILDDTKGVPVVILTEFNLLDRETKGLAPTCDFKSAIECPLFLMDNPDVRKSISFFCTLDVYKQLLEITKTQGPFRGGLVLTDTGLFDNYNDYILSAAYFDCKKVNFNIGLFYFVLWKNCESTEEVTENVKEQFKKYVMRRISMTICKIGLSSSPLYPQENVSLLTALWYCVELSSCIFKDDPRNFMQERMRTFYPVANWMIEILEYFNYDLDLESIEKRRELFRYVMILKDIPTRREKVYYLLEEIFEKVNGFLVSEIEKPFNLYKLNYLKFNHRRMLCDDLLEEKVNLCDYIYLANYVGDLSESEAGKCMFRVRSPTYSSTLTVEENELFCAELDKATRRIVISTADDQDKINITYEALDSLEFDNILCRYNLFFECVQFFCKYPTLSEYIEYIVKRHKFICEKVSIFPPNILCEAEDVYLRYQNIVKRLHVDQFIKECRNCIYQSAIIKNDKLLKKIDLFSQKK